jgi:hypothetical protein
MGRARAAARPALVAVLALAIASAARAQVPATVSIDDVRVQGGGRHRLTVSVLDAAGAPVPGLEHGFGVTLDGAAVEGLGARAGRAVAPEALVTLVVDPALLRGESGKAIGVALGELGRALAAHDRIRVVASGSRARSIEEAAAAADRLAGGLERLGGDETPLIYDALYGAARAAGRLPDSRAGVVLMLTRGVDGGSRRTPLEVVAAAHGPRREAPVTVVLIGESGASSEAERLHRMTEHAGGAFATTTSTDGLGPELAALAARGLDRWVLDFRAPEWRKGTPSHKLALTVEKDGVARSATTDYATADVVAAPWWTGPWPWALLGLLLVAGLALAVTGRRRQLGLLVHQGDEDDGVWYELFGFPVTLGAGAVNDIVFADTLVSRNHALMERRGRNVELVDLNSENGTFVNDERINRRLLVDGDRVSFGPHVHLIFEARG